MSARAVVPGMAVAALLASCQVYPGYPHEVSLVSDPTIWQEAVAGEAPPPMRAEDTGVAPSSLHVWIPGYWWWHARWIWIDGCWRVPPDPKYIWVSGHWESHPGRWIWNHGGWRAP